MKTLNSVVAIFDKHVQAEEAVKQLQKAGFEMKNLSIVGKGYHRGNRASKLWIDCCLNRRFGKSQFVGT